MSSSYLLHFRNILCNGIIIVQLCGPNHTKHSTLLRGLQVGATIAWSKVDPRRQARGLCLREYALLDEATRSSNSSLRIRGRPSLYDALVRGHLCCGPSLADVHLLARALTVDEPRRVPAFMCSPLSVTNESPFGGVGLAKSPGVLGHVLKHG
jgi:hypothetical protein